MKAVPGFSRRRLFSGRLMLNAARGCALALAAMCLGCGETNRQLFKRYEGPFGEKRQQFKRVADMLPPPGSLKGSTAANLAPKPVYDPKSGSSNTEIVMYDQLLDPDILSQTPNRFDLFLSGDLLQCIQWTGPRNPLTEGLLDKHVGNFEQTLKKGLGIRYLVALRPAKFVAPVAVNGSTFKGGMADIEGFIVDLESTTVAGSLRFTAQSARNVEYTYRPGESQETRLMDFAYDSLNTDARQKLQALLQQTTGGQFVLGK